MSIRAIATMLANSSLSTSHVYQWGLSVIVAASIKFTSDVLYKDTYIWEGNTNDAKQRNKPASNEW